METLKNIGLGLVAIILIAGIGAGLWFGGWALTRANKVQEREVNHTSQQWQDARIAEERNRVQGYDTATSPAQKTQIAKTFCVIYEDIENPPADLVSAHARICN